MDTERVGHAGPEVSVVVATHNRAHRLRMLLDALAAQTVSPERFEVVVVDDASDDDTENVLKGELARGQLNLNVIRHGSATGPAGAREAGWRSAKAELIAFTDDDCAPHGDWLEMGLDAMARSGHSFIQGRTEPVPSERHLLGPFTRTICVTELDAGFQTCNILYPRKMLESVGGFDTEVFDRSPGGEDADLAWRAIESGASAVFEPDVLVYHAVNELGPLGKLRVAARWTTPMKAYVRHRGLRDAHFVKGVFWKGSHYLLVRALVALLLPKRVRWLAPWLAVPYLKEIETRRRKEKASLAVLPYYAVHDLVELWAIGRAAVRYRHPMI